MNKFTLFVQLSMDRKRTNSLLRRMVDMYARALGASEMTGIRVQQREATRGKILKTARRLFLSTNFDQVGVREIATEAGVATGTVIAAFGSKADLLNAIVIQDLHEQLPLMEAAVKEHSNTHDRVIAACLACISYQSHQIAIVRASMADAWTRSEAAENRVRNALKPMLEFLHHELERGVSRGEIQNGVNLRLAVTMIIETLINTYRIPVYNAKYEPRDLGQMLVLRLTFTLRGICVMAHEPTPATKRQLLDADAA